MIEFRDWLNEEMKDSEFKKEFEELDDEFLLVRTLTEARKEAGMTPFPSIRDFVSNIPISLSSIILGSSSLQRNLEFIR